MRTAIGRLERTATIFTACDAGEKRTLVIRMLDGAGGAPGRQVLNAAASLHGPCPQELTAAMRSL